MELQFRQNHISIEEFDSIEIPNFVVLTGVNGSGKSHLLDALQQKKVIMTGMENANIIVANYTTFKLQNENSFSTTHITSEQSSAWTFFITNVKNSVVNWRSRFNERYITLKEQCKIEDKNFLDLEDDDVLSYRKKFIQYVESQRNNPQMQSVYNIAKKIPYSIDEIERDVFNHLYKPIDTEFLPKQLGKICLDYYSKYLDNQFNEISNNKFGKDNYILSEEEFLNIHGRKPWELINEILSTFNMPYRVTSPEGLSYKDSFNLTLMHTERSNIAVSFDSLSSGEKILITLVALIFKSNDNMNNTDVLLLDEIDASLHPSMINNMLDTIKKIFIDKQEMKVILVTHSPTTIALAPEESVYIMNKSGRNRIEKKSKQDALAILTQGFATLEQGLKLFDEITSKLTIVSEGKNTLIISKALEILGVNDVDVLSGCEDITGKNQLKIMFDFLSRIQHTNKVIFVWDCDVKEKEFQNLESLNNTFPFILPKNGNNNIAEKGIENMFPENLFRNFSTVTSFPNGDTISTFHSNSKRQFESFVLERNNPADFVNFKCLVTEIERIKSLE